MVPYAGSACVPAMELLDSLQLFLQNRSARGLSSWEESQSCRRARKYDVVEMDGVSEGCWRFQSKRRVKSSEDRHKVAMGKCYARDYYLGPRTQSRNIL